MVLAAIVSAQRCGWCYCAVGYLHIVSPNTFAVHIISNLARLGKRRCVWAVRLLDARKGLQNGENKCVYKVGMGAKNWGARSVARANPRGIAEAGLATSSPANGPVGLSSASFIIAGSGVRSPQNTKLQRCSRRSDQVLPLRHRTPALKMLAAPRQPRPTTFTNRQVANFFFRPCCDQYDEVILEYFRCTCGAVRKRATGTGYTNLIQHIRREHPAFAEEIIEGCWFWVLCTSCTH
ncbi:hypothetical protein GQ600_3841 [Phytophthora cactorum]|nr:hypothetical protein GQ600_3841 [Phytophthora cactorum]